VKVLINGHEIEFSLDGEKKVRDIIDSISEWSRQRDMVFTDFVLDGEPYTVDNCPDAGIDGIKSINCLVQSKGDLIIGTMNEGIVYCNKVMSFIDKSVAGGKADLVQRDYLEKGSIWLYDALNSIFQLLGIDASTVRYLDHPVSYYMDCLAETRKKLASVKNEDDFVVSLTEIRGIYEILRAFIKMLHLSDNLKQTLMKSLESPTVLIEELAQIKKELPGQQENLAKSSEAFQAGRDAEGADLLQLFIDFIYRYTRICHQISPVFGIDLSSVSNGDRSFDEVNGAIQSYLEEVVAVMENNDIISLSDILEYQIKVELENCGKFVDLLLEKIA
jgi:hypothetical protein